MMRTSEARIWRLVLGPVGTGGRASNGRRGMVLSPYFFFGPLLAIGVFGAAFVLLPPFFDMAYLLFHSGWRTRRPPTKFEAVAGVAAASEVEHALCQRRRQPTVDNKHRHVVAPNDRIARVRDVDRHS